MQFFYTKILIFTSSGTSAIRVLHTKYDEFDERHEMEDVQAINGEGYIVEDKIDFLNVKIRFPNQILHRFSLLTTISMLSSVS